MRSSAPPPRPARGDDCVRFLQWCLPELGLSWRGFRRVHRTVCKRLARRLRELGLADLDGYRAWLSHTPEEWDRLDAMCRIPISRFARDRALWDRLAADLLPALARAARAQGRRALDAWSAGCASGEEPYSLTIVWQLEVVPSMPGMALRVLATDVDPTMIERARSACYPPGALRDLRPEWRARAFEARDGEACLETPFRRGVTLQLADIRHEMPPGPFDLILCRNLAFTYFDAMLARSTLRGLHERMRANGLLAIGAHEHLPELAGPRLDQVVPGLPVYRREA